MTLVNIGIRILTSRVIGVFLLVQHQETRNGIPVPELRESAPSRPVITRHPMLPRYVSALLPFAVICISIAEGSPQSGSKKLLVPRRVSIDGPVVFLDPSQGQSLDQATALLDSQRREKKLRQSSCLTA